LCDISSFTLKTQYNHKLVSAYGDWLQVVAEWLGLWLHNLGLCVDFCLRVAYCLFYLFCVCILLFFAHIPFVVNHTISATPPKRLQQYIYCIFYRLRSICVCLNWWLCSFFVAAGVCLFCRNVARNDFSHQSQQGNARRRPLRQTCSLSNERQLLCYSTQRYYIPEGWPKEVESSLFTASRCRALQIEIVCLVVKRGFDNPGQGSVLTGFFTLFVMESSLPVWAMPAR